MKVINLDFLNDFTKGDDEKIKKYIAMYLKTAPDLIVQFKSLLAASDLDALKRTAHTLKSQSRYMGAESLSTLMQQLETACERDEPVIEIERLVGESLSLAEAVNEALNQYLSNTQT